MILFINIKIITGEKAQSLVEANTHWKEVQLKARVYFHAIRHVQGSDNIVLGVCMDRAYTKLKPFVAVCLLEDQIK